MGKYLNFFSHQYGCATLGKGSEEKEGENITVRGHCPCSLEKGPSQTCSFVHTIDPKGNVIKTAEEGCPCPLKNPRGNPLAPRGKIIKTETLGKSKGQKVGQAIAITVSVISGIIIIVGIIFIAKRMKGPKGSTTG